MPLILLSGLPGSGKTTFATALAAAAPAVVVESDAIRRSMVQQPAYTREEHERVFAEVERQVAEGLREGKLVVLDATNLKVDFRKRYHELAAENGEAVVCVVLTAPPGTLRERVAGPRDGHSQAGVSVLNELARDVERFREPTVVVDTRYDTGPSLRAVLSLAGVGE